MLDEICRDMRQCKMSTVTITNFVKFISSSQCEFVPEQVKNSNSAESVEFKKGCEELIEMAGVTPERRMETMPDIQTKKININGSKDLEAISNTSQDKEANHSTAENERDVPDDADPNNDDL